MINIKEEPFSYTNPYKTFSSSIGDKVYSLFETNQAPQETDKILAFADRIIEWGKDLLFHDDEKKIDFVGKAAKVFDWGVFGIVIGMQTVVIVDHIFHANFGPITGVFKTIIKIIAVPAAIFFVTMAFVEGFVELANMRRAGKLLSSIEKRKQDPLKALLWLKRRYFTLKDSQVRRIQDYVERTLPQASQSDKEKRFDQIATKVLQLRFESLKRRISPGLAQEVASQLETITRDLKSYIPGRQASALQRAELLMQSVNRQAKNKILIHFLGLIAIASTLISMTVFLSGVTAPVFFIAMGTITVSLVILSMIINKGTIAKEVEKLYDSLRKFNLPIKETGALFPSWQAIQTLFQRQAQ